MTFFESELEKILGKSSLLKNILGNAVMEFWTEISEQR